jgi:hypothetical protein
LLTNLSEDAGVFLTRNQKHQNANQFAPLRRNARRHLLLFNVKISGRVPKKSASEAYKFAADINSPAIERVFL